jgi:tyrosine-specific transport protein
MSKLSGKHWGGMMLIAGTAIGAGMLGLPLKTGVSGFFPSILGLGVGFSFMLLSLFVLLEANLYLTSWDANIISMAKARLGFWAQALAWVCFLLLLYAALAAYMSEGSSLILQFWQQLTPLSWHPSAGHAQQYGVYGFVLLFGAVVYLGTKMVDYVNRFLMIGLISAFVTLVVFSVPHIETKHLFEFYPGYLIASVPVIIASFTSHLILPTLRTYLENDIEAIKKVLLYGSFIPLVFYLVWEFIIVGMLPLHGDVSLISVTHAPHPVGMLTQAMHQHVSGALVSTMLAAFSFFALLTSFLAVALSLSDFLADGFAISKHNSMRRLGLMVMTFLPPVLLLVCASSEKTPFFLLALGYLGVFIAVLYGILPALMVWKGRYVEGIEAKYRAPGGKGALVILLLGSVAIIAIQIAATLGALPAP